MFHTFMDYFFMGFKTILRYDMLNTLITGILSTLMEHFYIFEFVFINIFTTNMLQKK